MILEQPDITPIRNPGLLFGKPKYRLDKAWRFTVSWETEDGQGDCTTYTIPAGYEFDGASVPRMFWGFPFGYTPDGVHRAAALEHDFLCDLGMKHKDFTDWYAKRRKLPPPPLPPAVVHAHFARRLKELGLRKGQVWTMGNAVKLFGPRWKT